MAATTVPSGQVRDSLLHFRVTVAAEEDAFPRLVTQAHQRTGVTMARQTERLVARCAVMEVQRRLLLATGDALDECGALALELDRRVAAGALGGVDLVLDAALVELEEVELHRVAAGRLALGAHHELGDERDEIVVVARKPLEGRLEMAGEPLPSAPREVRGEVLSRQPLEHDPPVLRRGHAHREQRALAPLADADRSAGRRRGTGWSVGRRSRRF